MQKEATEIPKYHAVYASAYAVAWSHSQAFPDLSSQSFAVCINGGRRPGVPYHAPWDVTVQYVPLCTSTLIPTYKIENQTVKILNPVLRFSLKLFETKNRATTRGTPLLYWRISVCMSCYFICLTHTNVQELMGSLAGTHCLWKPTLYAYQELQVMHAMQWNWRFTW